MFMLPMWNQREFRYPWLLRLRVALRTANSRRSSRRVIHTQNQEIISTKMKVKNTRFFSPSPPHVAAAYAGLCTCAEGWLKRSLGDAAYRGEEGLKAKE